MRQVIAFLMVMSTAPLPAESPDQAASPAPPVARRVPKVDVVHGDRREDDYFWIRDKKDPEVKAYLEAENAYTDAILKPTEGLRESLYKEMLSRIKETDVNVPYRKGGFFYYSRTEQGKQYPIYCRKKGSLEAPEQVTIDLNELAKGEKFMSLAAYSVSDDGRLLAYSTDNTGFRQYTLFVKDLETGALKEKVAEKVGSVAWAADNQTLFYTVEEESTKRQYRLFRHVLDTDRHDLAYEEKDEAFNIGVARGRSEKYLFLGMGSLTTSEVRFLPAEPRPGRLAHRGPPHRRSGVRGRAPRRRLLHPHERHGPQLPPREGQGGEPGTRALAGGGAGPKRRDARGHGLLQGLLRAPRARERPAPGPRHRPAHRGMAPHRLSRAHLFRLPQRQRRVRHQVLPLHLPVARDPELGLRLRHGEAHLGPAEATRGPGRL